MIEKIPKISVILPAYNAELYIEEAIKSILNQTFTDFELLLYNDGSVDKTHDIINSFKDERITYKKTNFNQGYLTLLNDGLTIARGKYIARMDADDIATVDRFVEQFNFLENHPDVGICGSWVEIIGNPGGVVERPVTFEQIQYALFFGCPLTHPTVMMRTDLIRKYNLKYKPEYYYAEDHYFFAEASFHFPLVNLPKPLLKYRIHNAQIGSIKWKEQFIIKSNIQAKLFFKVIQPAADGDFNWLINFFEETGKPDFNWLSEVDSYKKRILSGNEQLNIYPPEILLKATTELFNLKVERNFFVYFFQKYYNVKKYNLALLYNFFKENYKPQKYLGARNTFLFVVKCLISYRKKTIIRL